MLDIILDFAIGAVVISSCIALVVNILLMTLTTVKETFFKKGKK